MTTQGCFWSPLFHKSVADGAKSLIALLVLIAVVSTMSPNFLPSITCSIFCSKPPLTPLWR